MRVDGAGGRRSLTFRDVERKMSMTKNAVLFSLAVGLGLVGCGSDGGGDPPDAGPDCTPTEIVCGGVCVDPDSDPDYCGATAACDDGVVCAAVESCEAGICEYQGGCADGTSEVVWSDDVQGCAGPNQSWLLYTEEQTTYCEPGWVIAGADIVNSLLVSDAYTDDVMYAFDGEGCEGKDSYGTRHDASSQDRGACSWSDSHHESIDESTDVQGIVCQRQPAAVDPRYMGPAGTDHSASGWVLCGHVPIQDYTTFVDPYSAAGLAGCLRRGLREFMIERPAGICETGDQLGWEYPDDQAEVTLDWQLSSRTNSGWISPSFSGSNTCGILSSTSWNTTTEVESYDDGPLTDGESWVYYQR